MHPRFLSRAKTPIHSYLESAKRASEHCKQLAVQMNLRARAAHTHTYKHRDAHPPSAEAAFARCERRLGTGYLTDMMIPDDGSSKFWIVLSAVHFVSPCGVLRLPHGFANLRNFGFLNLTLRSFGCLHPAVTWGVSRVWHARSAQHQLLFGFVRLGCPH